MNSSFPLPPPELAARIGGSYEEYGAIAEAHRRYVESMLPEGWSFAGKSVLDFGCGLGRTMAAFESRSAEADFSGCDIHAPSIEWASRAMSPPFRFFTCQDSPPLPVDADSFDLVYAMSVFTHITDAWSAWLVELHRVMRSQGVAIISVLGPAMAHQILGHEWDERIGMAIVDLHKGWDIGGPDVLLSDWWIREHWGRAFEILAVQHAVDRGGHDLVVIRKRDVKVSREELEAIRPAEEVREREALEVNVELLAEQLSSLGSIAQPAAPDTKALEETVAALREQLAAIEGGRSWRLTAPLRAAAARWRQLRAGPLRRA
jgi:SAM-dependent methyltransferase